MRQRLPVLLLTFSLMYVKASSQNDLSNDGPYVFYRADSIFVQSVSNKNSFKKVQVTSYPLSQKNDVVVPVTFAGNNNFSFSVKLKPSLQNEPDTWPAPSKLLVLSDIEGEFEALRLLLIANGVMDKNFRWIFGAGHLVICGDLFDRGLNVPEQMWLLYKLEQEAPASGGYVHVILGNHDIMNLSNDVRYVQPKYFETASLFGMNYNKFYDQNSELGRWLRTKNIVEKIGDLLCLHAGISPVVNDLNLSVQKINRLARPNYDKSEEPGVYNDKKLLPLFSGNTSPFWYRGYFMQPGATQSLIDSTLKIYDVKKIVVGHTIAPSNINWYYQQKVIGLDVDQHANQHQAALYQDGKWYVVDDTGRKTLLK